MNITEEKQALTITEQQAITAALIRMIKESPVFQGAQVQADDVVKPGNIGVFSQGGSVYLRKFLSGSFFAKHTFFLIYRTKPSTDTQKINGSERLDALAQWLEGRAVTYNGRTYQLAYYPPLTDDRRLDSIERESSVYPTTPEQDGTINYRINMQLTYLKQQS